MRVGIDYGEDHLEVEIRQSQQVDVRRQAPAPALVDPVTAVRQALEAPSGFPALRRALTPDDHVAIVLDEHLPNLPGLLTPVLEHIAEAQVAARAITLLCPPSSTDRPWVHDLPAAFREVQIEVHDPADRRHLSYLATTRHGRRIYLNRTAVDAEQLVVLAQRGYDPLLGYSGLAGALYPALSDEATRQEMCGRLSLAVPGQKPWPARQEAAEVAWLLGAPFMLQIIAGAGQEITYVVGGLIDTDREGQHLLDARWRIQVDQRPDTVVAALAGDPTRHDFADLAHALACASRVVKPSGRIVLLSRARPVLGAGAELMRQAEDPGQALMNLRRKLPADMAAAFEWASAVQQATVYLFSDLPQETAEELFTTPLDDPHQVQRLLDQEGSCLFLADADKTLAVPADLSEKA